MALEAQNNPFTSILMVEAADPEALASDADPGAGQRRIVIGTDHVMYLLDDSGVKHAIAGTGLTDPMTTRGDVIVRNASNVTARLGRGSASQVLTSDGTDVAWATPSSGFPTTVYQSATSNTSISAGAAAADINGASVSLTAGTWDITAVCCFSFAAGTAGYLRLSVTDSSNVSVGVGRGIQSTLGSANNVSVFAGCRVTPGSTTTYKLRAESLNASTVVQQDLSISATWIRAIKVA